MSKKKVLFHSSCSKLKSGFGRNAKEILLYLFNTGKYDIVEYATAPIRFSDQIASTMPWKCYGALPNNDSDLQVKDQNVARAVQYGSLYIDKIIELERPDIYIGVEDFWAFNGFWDKPWWNKIPCLLWTTLDSLPIYTPAIENALKIKNYWVWASFAEKEMKRLGFGHVKTVNGVVNVDEFYPLNDFSKTQLRQKYGLDRDTVYFGFVFRNQLRKLVGSLLEGFRNFKLANKDKKAKIILHTNWGEGWNIPEFMKEFGLKLEDVLTSYVCGVCLDFTIRPFTGQGLDCAKCGTARSVVNPTTTLGVTESQLNELYNLMDAYVHPMTSGGLELPIVEAMLAGLPVATVPYSCGTEFTDTDLAYSLKFREYREVGSNFRKATADPDSIAKFMGLVCNKPKQFKEIGRKSNLWAKHQFSIERIGPILEEFIDSQKTPDYDLISLRQEKKNPDYPFNEGIANDTEWLLDMYENILKMKETTDSKGVKDWLSALAAGVSKRQIYDYFIGTAIKENQASVDPNEATNQFLENFEDSGKPRLMFVMPQSIGDCVISLSIIEQLRVKYEGYDIYVSTQPAYFDVFRQLNWIKKIIPYNPAMDNFQFLEGGGSHKGCVDIAFIPYVLTQRVPCYTHNGLDKNFLQS
jgi:glycosyltransferase involved in cell wall biosynthesis